MRFIAAFLVFGCHISLEHLFRDEQTGHAVFRLVSRAGWMGVEFFFVLSGFVLTWSARPDDTVPRFWRRRAAKIYPNHVVMWLVTIVLMLWAGQTVAAYAAIPNLLLVHSWFPQFEIFSSVNGPSWSLCCEVLFHLARGCYGSCRGSAPSGSGSGPAA